ncbi:MAG: hypothetical protein IPJ65_08420 [Archangiaceae bacterium]|nr:hypothetical protein [Archangiaceae bacterium]
MTRAAAIALLALAAQGCRCALPADDALYACEPDGGCPDGQRCLADELCHPLDAGAAGGTGGQGGGGALAGGGGGGTAGAGGAAGGGVACTLMPDLPDDLGVDSNCDGVDGIADGGIFVDPLNGTPGGFGTARSPVDSLSRAMTLAGLNGGHSIFVATGELHEAETVTLRADAGFSIYGGYTRRDGGWPREFPVGCGDGGRPRLNGAALALWLDHPTAGVVIDHLCISSADADAGASIAVLVSGGAPARLRFVDLVAGRGADGLDGADADAGAGGQPGGPGLESLWEGPRNRGGRGGDGACPGASGFDGGDGAQGDTANNGFAGLGPAGGRPGSYVDDGCTTSCACAMASSPGADGGDGDAGRPGTNGPHGDGLGAVTPSGSWVPRHAINGFPGGVGFPGSGGGGAGSYRVHVSSTIVLSGASGGGGGAAGCGGPGGERATSGGASIGLLIVGSRPTLDGEVRVQAGRGGSGGLGGRGGPGGEGGPGGPGGPGRDVYCDGGTVADAGLGTLLTGTRGNVGGNGGTGGRGGPGGNGGNGAGGASVGIWCTDAGFLRGGSATVNPFAGAPGDGGPGATGSLAAGVLGCP